MKYLKILKQLAVCSTNTYIATRIDSSFYLLGKLARFGFYYLFILSLYNYTDTIAGYSRNEVLLFFLTFNLMDVLSQAIFRGIYNFKNEIRLGNFDFLISKPVNTLFYIIFKQVDILDILFLVPIISLIISVVLKLNIAITLATVSLFLIAIIIGMVIILGIHILTACVTIWTLESENIIWLYRETMSIGRFPPEVYSASIQFFFIYIFPIFVINAFPAKAILNLLSIKTIIISGLIAITFYLVTLMIWKISVNHYSSASS